VASIKLDGSKSTTADHR